jgi:hypothetical protein
MFKYLLLILCIFLKLNSTSQKELCGVWETFAEGFCGIIAIYGIDSSGNIYGISYDEEGKGFCSYFLEGKYNNGRIKAKNTSVIERTKWHSGSNYRLNYKPNSYSPYINTPFLNGKVSILNNITYMKVNPDNYSETKGYKYFEPYIKNIQNNCMCIKDTLDPNSFIPFIIENRKNTLQETFKTNVTTIELKISDWNDIDSDTLSVYLNNEFI